MDMILLLILAIMQRYFDYINKINDRRRGIEKRVAKKVNDEDVYALHQMESSLIYFITSLGSLQPVMDKVQKNLEGKIDDTTDDILQNVIIMLAQNSERATIFKEVVEGARNLCNTMVSNDLNDIMKLLTVITLVLSIPVLIAGIYGMNVALPMSDYRYGFEVVCILMVISTVAVMWVLRKKRIL